MPGEITTLLLGAQGGKEDSFVRLYEVSNPIVLRYVRVVSDADPAAVALSTWSTLLPLMPAFVADDDDEWIELAVGTARETALVSGGTPAPGPAAPTVLTSVQPDPVDQGIAALRACGPVAADLLAMGVVAGLGRDSMARLTGQDPRTVHELVHDGQARLTVPLETLLVTLRAPGSPAELGDLPAVRSLFVAQSHSTLPKVAIAATAVAAAEALPLAALGEPNVVALGLGNSPSPATSRAVLRHSAAAETSPRWVQVGVGVAAWAIALGGVGTAAAMTGVVPAVLHNLFGDQGNHPLVTAQGPQRPGSLPPVTGGGAGPQARPPRQGPGPQVPAEPPTPTDVPVVTSGDGVAVATVSTDAGTALTVVVVPTVFNDTSSPATPPSTPTPTPSRPPVTPPSPTPRPPNLGGDIATMVGKALGRGHLKHSTGLAKGRAKAALRAAAKAAAKARASAARADARAKAAAARAAKADARAKAAAAKARAKAAAATARAKALQART